MIALLLFNSVLNNSPTDLNISISEIFEYVSIIFLVCVTIPQLYQNWRNQSSESVSLQFLYLSAVGDVCSLIGAIAQSLITSTIILAVYYLLADIVLILQVIYYRKKTALANSNETQYIISSNGNSNYKSLYLITDSNPVHYLNSIVASMVLKTTMFFVSFLFSLIALLSFFKTQRNSLLVFSEQEEPHIVWWAAALGWVSTVFLSVALIHQVWFNYCHRSTQGLSMTMFILSCFGNISYVISILAYSSDPEYLICNLPWLAGLILPCFLNFMVILQFYIYRNATTSLQV